MFVICNFFNIWICIGTYVYKSLLASTTCCEANVWKRLAASQTVIAIDHDEERTAVECLNNKRLRYIEAM